MIRIDEDLYKEVQALAQAESRSATNMLHILLKKSLEANNGWYYPRI